MALMSRCVCGARSVSDNEAFAGMPCLECAEYMEHKIVDVDFDDVDFYALPWNEDGWFEADFYDVMLNCHGEEAAENWLNNQEEDA